MSYVYVTPQYVREMWVAYACGVAHIAVICAIVWWIAIRPRRS